MKLLVMFVMIMATLSAASGQAVCDRTLATLPDIAGFRLGVSSAEVDRAFLKISLSTNEANFTNPSNVPRLENVWTRFYKDRLSSIELDFERTAEWKDVRGFAQVLQKTLRLPISSWVFVDTTEAMIECSDFKAAISTVRNTLLLTDTFARTAEKQDAARAASASTRQRIMPTPGN